MFLKPKNLSQQVEDKEAKLRMKKLDIDNENMDITRIRARQRKAAEIKRLQA